MLAVIFDIAIATLADVYICLAPSEHIGMGGLDPVAVKINMD